MVLGYENGRARWVREGEMRDILDCVGIGPVVV